MDKTDNLADTTQYWLTLQCSVASAMPHVTPILPEIRQHSVGDFLMATDEVWALSGYIIATT